MENLLTSELVNFKDHYLRIDGVIFDRKQDKKNYYQFKEKLENIFSTLFDTEFQKKLNCFGLQLQAGNDSLENRDIFVELLNYFESYLKVSKLNSERLNTLIDIFNTFYEITYYLMNEVIINEALTNGEIDYFYPRLTLVRESVGKSFHFTVDFEKLAVASKTKNILSYFQKKSLLYTDLIGQGKDAISYKNYPEAFKFFQKALDIERTAEALTLIGWSCSFLGRIEEAKDFCLEAVKLDPSYGNAYNDLGSYYLQENKLELAKDWFEKAKTATNYANCEYPYINLGKVYIMEREFDLAKSEFEQAMELAPYNKELKSSYEKLIKFMSNYAVTSQVSSKKSFLRKRLNDLQPTDTQ